MAVARNDAVTGDSPSPDAPSASTPPLVRGALVVGVVGVLAGIVMAFVLPAVAQSDWSKDAKAAEAVANDFIVTCYAIDTTDVEATRTALEPLVTEAFTTTCLDLLAPTEEEKSVVAASEVTFGDVVVTSIGTTQVDGDSANVVVTFSFTAVSPQASTAVPFTTRGIVHLSKSGDVWRVSDYSEIQQVEATIDAPADTPEGTTPTPEATP